MIEIKKTVDGYNHKFFEESKEEIRTKGYFECNNPELWNRLYEVLKPEFPTLYKSSNHNWQYLHIIKPEQLINIVGIIEKRKELKKEVEEIDFILEKLGLNPKEYEEK